LRNTNILANWRIVSTANRTCAVTFGDRALQLLDPDYWAVFHRNLKKRIYRTMNSAVVIKDIFLWIVRPRRSVNYC